MKVVSCSVVLAVLLILMCVSPASADLLSATGATVSPGGSGNVEIQMFLNQVNGTYPVIGAFDLTLTYAPAVVTPLSVSFWGFLGDLILGEAIAATDLTQPGLVNMFEVSLLSGPELSQLQQNAQVINNIRVLPLATMDFQIVNIPNVRSDLDFLTWTISDDQGNLVPVTVRAGFIASTPEPASIVLLGLVVTLIAGVLWRRTGHGERRSWTG